MTEPDTERSEARHRALMAVAAAVRESGGKDKLLAEAFDRWPRLRGATIADVLDMTDNYDMFLDITEPFGETHDAELPPVPAVRFALHALIILGGELTVTRLLQLLSKAGYGPRQAGYDDAMAGRAGDGAAWPEALRPRYLAGWRAGDLERRAPAGNEVRTAYDPLPDLAGLLAALTASRAASWDGQVGAAYRRLAEGLAWTVPAGIEDAIRDALGSFITRTGKLLTPAELDACAAEAGRGYDPRQMEGADVVVTGGLGSHGGAEEFAPAPHPAAGQLVPLDPAAAERLRRAAQMGDGCD